MTPRLTDREFGVGGRVAAGWTLGCFGESVGVWNHFGRAVGVQQLVDKAEDSRTGSVFAILYFALLN